MALLAGIALFVALATAAKVGKLVAVVVGAVALISMIIQGAATAREIMAKCEQLACLVYMTLKMANRIIDSFFNLFPTSQEGAGNFTVAQIRSATNNFAHMIGEGVSGEVYKGELHDGRVVAVKRLKDGLRRAEGTFGMELAILQPLSHDHIVRLVGSCAERGHHMLVYEHMYNGTLRDHLDNASLSWTWITRVQVLLGAARAIKHLHCHAVSVIHSNVTSSNILLNQSLTPHLSGFGASVRRAPDELSQAVDVVQTYGYDDPEYRITGRLKPATDVYSFGVVMLEVLTGKPVVATGTMLVSWALPSIQARKLGDVLDRRPASEPTARQCLALQLVAKTAERCLCMDGDKRLAISQVVKKLEEAFQLICNDD